MLGRIAIHLSNDNSCARRVDAGLQLAKKYGTEVVGVYPSDGITGNSFNDSIIPQDVRQILRNRNEQHRTTICQMFEEKAEAAGVKFQVRTPKGDPEQALALHARYCDFMVMSKADSSDSSGGILPNLPEAVVMAAGRPVFMVPNIGNLETIGDRILYCWDQRREAARAFNDASPFLKTCKELVVLEIDRDTAMLQNTDIQHNDFSDYCKSLGYVAPKIAIKSSEDVGVGNVILNTASDHSSDLIVMGAYGHSRMRQWIMGGATRTLLSTMTVPVLLSH